MSSSSLEKCSADPCGRQVTLVVSRLELWRRASTHGDLQAWAAFQQSLEETALTWFHAHPGSAAACRVHSEKHFVALAFERLRQATIQGQVTCETLSEVLVFLRVSLNGAILETLRVSKRPGAVSSRKTASTGASSGIGYKRGSPTGRSNDWLIYCIIVGWNPPRLCASAHRNGAMFARSLVCGAASSDDS
jgi:hypothetical protein